MKCLFMGYNDSGYAVLETLVRLGSDLRGIVIPNNTDYYRVEKFIKLSEEKNINLFKPNSPKNKEFQAKIASLSIDLIIVAAYPKIIPKSFLEIPNFTTINFHGAPLPKYRGANALNWVLVNGETETAMTIHVVDQGIDSGDILFQDKIEIDYDDDALSLRKKMELKSQEMLVKYWPLIIKKELNPISQNSEIATYFRKRTPEDGRINWNIGAGNIRNLIRALVKPYPGAFFEFNNRIFKIFSGQLVKDYNGKSGEILEVNDSSIRVCCKNDSIIIRDIFLEGKEIKNCFDFFKVGDQL